jgi:hypothetical protein
MLFVTHKAVERALRQVQTELGRYGFWTSRIKKVGVVLGSVGTAHGSYGPGNEIRLPRFSFSAIEEKLRGTHTSLRDVLRHEYGHAIASAYPGLIRTRQFRNAFGASHDSGVEREFDYSAFISGYAATNPSEDFAETFMLFLKHHGALPHCYRFPVICSKWNFIRHLCRKLKIGELRW